MNIWIYFGGVGSTPRSKRPFTTDAQRPVAKLDSTCPKVQGKWAVTFMVSLQVPGKNPSFWRFGTSTSPPNPQPPTVGAPGSQTRAEVAHHGQRDRWVSWTPWSTLWVTQLFRQCMLKMDGFAIAMLDCPRVCVCIYILYY